MQCQNCSGEGLNRDRLFVNGWHVSRSGALLLVLTVVAISNWDEISGKASFVVSDLIEKWSIFDERKQDETEVLSESETSTIETDDGQDSAVFASFFEPRLRFGSKLLSNSDWEFVDDRPLEKSVLNAIERWREAIETGNSETYFSSYHESFTPASQARSEWEDLFRGILASRKIQRIRFNNLKMNFSADKIAVGVKFHQKYEFESQRQENVKRMFLTKVDGKWLIAAEADEK